MDMMDRLESKIKLSDKLADVPVLLWGMSAICKAACISRSTLERERSAGRFPHPDMQLGRKPLWRPESIREWIERGGRP